MVFRGIPSGRAYYGPALLDVHQDPFASSDTQSVAHPTSSSLWSAAKVGAIGYAGYRAGFMDIGGQRGWDRVTTGLRWFEEASPAHIFRTFQLSTLASQFSSKAAGSITPQMLAGADQYRKYVGQLIRQGGGGPGTMHRLTKEGVTLKGGQLFWGTGTDIALQSASGLVHTKGPAQTPGTKYRQGPLPRAAESHFLSLGLDPGQIPKGGKTPANISALRKELDKLPFMITGGKSTRQNVARQLSAQFTEFMSRPNRLLQAPFEMEPMQTVFKKFGTVWERLFDKELRLGVKPGTGTQMLGRMAKKFGLYLPAAYLGYETLDWAGRETVGAGPTDVAVGAWTGSQLLASHAAQATGLHAYREAQEEIAPGSTTLKKLIAFPLMGAVLGATGSFTMRQMKMQELRRQGKSAGEASAAAVKFLGEFKGKGPLARLGRQLTETQHLYSQPGRLGRLMRKVAEPTAEGALKFKLMGKVGPAKLLAGVGAAIGAALVAPFLPGALVPSTRPDELAAIYSGEQEVPIRKGRWWEFGRTPYEGTRIDYFRPNWTARMAQRGKEKMIWGDDADLNPISKFIRKEFTYELERKHFHDRPYPVSSLPFEDMPFVGPIVASTLGRVIKPEVYMHQNQWGGAGGALDLGPGFGGRIATELGETPMGMPISPYGAKGLIGEQAYRMTEMIGLPGFMAESIKESMTGTGTFFEEERQLESARRIAGFEREYWDLNLGGLLGSTEAFRRMFPHRRRQIELYNPIRNTMPSWLPGHSEKSPDFLHGDPFTKVTEGEMRLPGAGYATRYSELEGLTPEDYPLIHQFKILADIAPYSDKFKLAKQEINSARKREAWSEYEERIYQAVMVQTEARKSGKEFNEYQYLSPMGEVFGEENYYNETGRSSAAIAAVNRMKADNTEAPGLISSLYGGYWEWLSHGAETALDQLTPISPYSKLVHMRTAIEDYESMQLYGTQNSFWNHPIRDFARPFSQMTMASLGADGVPHHIQERRSLEEYFDILKYVKNARLSNVARTSKDSMAVATFEQNKDRTLFGTNPYTPNLSSLFRSMPRRERDYFNAFSSVKTEEERNRILEMVPGNMKGIYEARWRLALADDIKLAKKGNYLSGKQLEEADVLLNEIYDDAKAEGMPKTTQLWAQYLSERTPGESYGDWYRRTQLLPEMGYLPGPDWVGWHPSVDLEDVKLQVVENMGEDMHDYDLWPSRQARMQNKAYINTQAAEEILDPGELSGSEMYSRVQDLLYANQIYNADVFVREGGSPQGSSSVTMRYDKTRQEPTLEELLS